MKNDFDSSDKTGFLGSINRIFDHFKMTLNGQK